MQTPVLSERQQKKTLSAKKVQKQTIKNVLGNPYRQYWPLLSSDDQNRLAEVLYNHLPQLNGQKSNVPWSAIKNIPKELRKQFRLDYNKIGPKEQNKHLIVGVNEVTKRLEKCDDENVACVLIASDVSPQLLVKHVVDTCVMKAVPILIVTRLRELLKSRIGFGSVVLGISDTDDADLKTVITTVVDLSSNYPVPEGHFNYERHLSALDDKMDVTAPGQTDENKNVEKPEEGSETTPRNVYLYRKDKKKRVFIPATSDTPIKCEEMDIDRNDFVPIDEDPKNTNWRPLTVKRIRSDKDRNKRKLKRLKSKKL